MPNLTVGVREPANEERPQRVVIEGFVYAELAGARVSCPENNHWAYVCSECGIHDRSPEYFEHSHYFFHEAWVCVHCISTAEHDAEDTEDCDCADCQNNRYRADNIQEYDYTPTPLFFRTDAELKSATKIYNDLRKKRGLGAATFSDRFGFDQDRTPFIAFEIEVENENNLVRNGEAVSNVEYDWNFAKYDGSLQTGFEIVSHPFTFDYFNGPMLEEWQRTLRSLKADGFTSYNAETCGMHVHISKEAFTNYHLYRFLRIWYFSKRFTMWMSKRSRGSFDQWAGFNKNGSYPIVRKAKDKFYRDKYESVNLAHEQSVEIRIFRGTLHPDSFRRNIETVHAAFQFSDPYSADKVKTSEITPDGFAKYVRTHQKTYPQLFNHFWNHGHVVSEIARETISQGEI